MARPAGFEPATYELEVRCSILAELRAHPRRINNLASRQENVILTVSYFSPVEPESLQAAGSVESYSKHDREGMKCTSS